MAAPLHVSKYSYRRQVEDAHNKINLKMVWEKFKIPNNDIDCFKRKCVTNKYL